MDLLLITSAIEEELIELEDLNHREIKLGKNIYKIILLPLGIGKLNALYNLMNWYNNHRKDTLKEIIFLGSCGSYDLDYKQDFIASCNFINYDYASLTNQSKSLPEVSKLIKTEQGEVAKSIAHLYHWEFGIVNSTDSITLKKIDKNLLLKKINNHSIGNVYENLEAYGIALFCSKIKIPFTAFLSITNAVYENGSEEWLKNYQSMAKKLNLMIKNYLKGILDSSFF